MTKKERRQIAELWADLENIVTILDPGLDLREYFELSDDGPVTFDDVKELVDLIRIQIKYLKLDLEACNREKSSLLRMISELGKDVR